MKPVSRTAPIPVTAAILEHQGRVLIARRGPDDPMAGRWELPGGKVEAGESPRACLQRELFEEFGVLTAFGAFFGASVHHYAHISIRLLAYRARLVEGEIRLTVHDRCRWVPVTRLGAFDFCAADQPLVTRLIRLQGGVPDIGRGERQT
jgi:8-oxo-dGTP diphosphatase